MRLSSGVVAAFSLSCSIVAGFSAFCDVVAAFDASLVTDADGSRSVASVIASL